MTMTNASKIYLCWAIVGAGAYYAFTANGANILMAVIELLQSVG